MASEVSVQGWLDPLLWAKDKPEYHGSGSRWQSCSPHGSQEAVREKGREQDTAFKGMTRVTYFLQLSPVSRDSTPPKKAPPTGTKSSTHETVGAIHIKPMTPHF
jgi:hypothetical protein